MAHIDNTHLALIACGILGLAIVVPVAYMEWIGYWFKKATEDDWRNSICFAIAFGLPLGFILIGMLVFAVLTHRLQVTP